MMDVHVPYYLDYLSTGLLERAAEGAEAVDAVPDLVITAGLRESFPTVLTDDALRFVVALYRAVHPSLRRILDQRRADRARMDARTRDCVSPNEGVPYRSPAYRTILGMADDDGEVLIGPSGEPVAGDQVAVPDFMAGDQVTLFGPPDSAKMSINAMNTLHRKLPDEPAVVAELVAQSGQVPRWGADNEDSKTPIIGNLLAATQNLVGCYRRTLRFSDPARGRTYTLADSGLAKPIKRIPGLALPDANHQLSGNPLPLHLLDFALHVFHNWDNPEALVFYVPKLETEQEAAYLSGLISLAEDLLQARHPAYVPGSVRLFIVFENPRAIFRIREIAQALHPHFLGGSLGWHDFLGSTARLFRFDPCYRIPVKADPNIVINHIRESHQILVDALAPIGGLKIGGMYGILYEDGNPASFEVSMVGYIKDVVTQMKRGLDGFWVAHPNFVRIGIALVQAWRLRQADPTDDSLTQLVTALVPNPAEQTPLLSFIAADDVAGLPRDHPLYLRGVLAADIATSDVIANHHPDEVRYNVFQAIQYLTDWLSGNGCVALPATMKNASGETVFVRIMDDLATTERSRWELWAEVFHGRVPVSQFESILAEELAFIRAGQETATRRIQVHWSGDAARWYPIAARLLRQLVLDPDPVEFATELLMPFTVPAIRESADPWATASALCPGRFTAPTPVG
jgi:malate synthase